MLRLIPVIALSVIAFCANANQPVTHIETTKQTIKYDPNGPYGRQLISVEQQRVISGYKDDKGNYHKSGERRRSVASMIPLDR